MNHFEVVDEVIPGTQESQISSSDSEQSLMIHLLPPSPELFDSKDDGMISEAREMQETQITPNQQQTASFNLNIIVFEFDFVTKENFVFLLMGEPVGCWPFISSRKHANAIEHDPNGSLWQPAVVVILPAPSPPLNRQKRIERFRADIVAQLRVIERALHNIRSIVHLFPWLLQNRDCE